MTNHNVTLTPRLVVLFVPHCLFFLFCLCFFFFFFFFNDTATTEIYTLSLHDALPILSEFTLFLMASTHPSCAQLTVIRAECVVPLGFGRPSPPDRKSTRLNSSHL